MFAGLGRFAHRWRWAVIGGWLVLTLAGAVFGGQVFDRLTTVDSLDPASESLAADRRVGELVTDGDLVLGIVQGRDVYDPELVASVSDVVADISTMAGVVDVDDLYALGRGEVGPDNQSTVVRVKISKTLPAAERAALVNRVSDALHRIDAPRVLVGGKAVAEREFGDQAIKDAAIGESIALVVVAFVLVLILGGVLAASLPVSAAIATICATLLGLFLVSQATSVPEYTVNVVTLLGFGLAIDYALLMIFRYREELRRTGDPAEALTAATAAAGRAVLVAGLAIGAALAGLAVFAEPLLAAMAAGGAIVVIVATACGLTLVPALIAVMGHRIPPAGTDTRITRAVAAVRARLPFAGRRSADGRGVAPTAGPSPAVNPSPAAVGDTGRAIGRATVTATLTRAGTSTAAGTGTAGTGTGSGGSDGGLLGRLAVAAQRRPGPVALGVTVGLLFLAAPFFGANLSNSDARALPRSAESRQVYETMLRDFPGSSASVVTVVVEAPPASVEVRDYLNQLDQMAGVQKMQPRPDVGDEAAIVDLTVAGDSAGPAARDLVREVRALDTPFRTLVGGPAAEIVDYQDSVASRLPWAVLVVAVASAILLFALTGSVLVPIKALILNALTLLASLGVLVVVFQWGLGEVVLNFDSWGGIDLTTPVLLFVFVFGLTMDYEVFLLARIKEEWDRHGDNARAVLAGIQGSGRAVTAAATCITVVFLGFMLGGLTAVKELGFGMAVAVILDVTVVRGLLLPAVMTMLGRWNWWAPAFLRRTRPPARLPATVGARTTD